MLYCPKCASQAVEGQRFCRNCGTNLGLILDAMEGKRGPLDFDSLKEDLRQLGSSLRSGFEEARQNIKKTSRLAKAGGTVCDHVPAPEISRIRVRERRKGDQNELRYSVSTPVVAPQIKIKDKNNPHPRRYSFQQATLSIIGGGASCAVLYYFFNTAASSGLVASLAHSLMKVNPDLDLSGVEPVVRMLWMLGLVGVAKGIAHLINGIFFAPKPERAAVETSAPAPGFVPEPSSYATPGAATPTNEFERNLGSGFRPSITEDPTAQFEPREADRVPSKS